MSITLPSNLIHTIMWTLTIKHNQVKMFFVHFLLFLLLSHPNYDIHILLSSITILYLEFLYIGLLFKIYVILFQRFLSPMWEKKWKIKLDCGRMLSNSTHCALGSSWMPAIMYSGSYFLNTQPSSPTHFVLLQVTNEDASWLLE